jgi:hypothetical protein
MTAASCLRQFVQLVAATLIAAYPPECAIPQCSTPCPEGQYLALDSRGCETCDCYDPCQSVNCAAGKCYWLLDNSARPRTFCAECPSGQTWQKCGPGSCISTCSNTSPVCPRNCFPGCYCPDTSPVWHREQCITADQCKDVCDGNQVWTVCGTEETITCTNPRPQPSPSVCISRCQCPKEQPVWDERNKLCVTEDQCLSQELIQRLGYVI